MKKPDFFIIGAPRCGTSALRDYLKEHPKLCVPPWEPEFFCTDYFFSPRAQRFQNEEEYLRECFGDCKENQILGEKSVWYLYSKEAIPRILAFNPEAKFLVCVRNPIEMVRSLHAEYVLGGTEDIKDFQSAWRSQDSRLQRKKAFQDSRDPQFLPYREVGKLGTYLEHLYTMVPKEQVMVVVNDDLLQDPRQVYIDVLGFLGVPFDGRKEFVEIKEHRQKKVRWQWLDMLLGQSPAAIHYGAVVKRALGIRRELGIRPKLSRLRFSLNMKVEKSQPLPPEFKKELEEYFLEEVVKLSRILKRDFSYWYGT